jgi:hypothetical protein
MEVEKKRGLGMKQESDISWVLGRLVHKECLWKICIPVLF